MKWFESTAESLQEGVIYKHSELIDLLKRDYPYVRDNSYHWAIQEMLKSGKIVHAGYNQYVVADGMQKPLYDPHYTSLANKLIQIVSDRYTDLKFVVLEMAQFNEFFQITVPINLIIIQVEQHMDLQVFHYLQEEGFAGLMYKPSKQMYDLYKMQNGILIETLTSEAPLLISRPHAICIEKLIVDMICDKYIKWELDCMECNAALENAVNTYRINIPRILRYAERRGKQEAVILSMPELLGQDTINNALASRQRDLIQAAAHILDTLPRSQQELYIDINGGKQSQADMARYYHVTPQAITNRINRLYKTVTRRLQEEHGFTIDELGKVGDGSAMSFFRHVPRQDTNLLL